MSQDPLSDIFALFSLASVRCTRLEAGAAWALQFPHRERLKFVAILRGAAWIVLPDGPPYLLETGDTFLLTNTPFVLASDLNLQTQDGNALFESVETDIVTLGGSETVMLGGAFVFADDNAQMLVDALPGFMHIPARQQAAAVLRDTLAILDRELEQPDMGSPLMRQRLADILLIQALRAYVAEYGPRAAGWIGALSDSRIGGGIKLMHGDIGRCWTVGELAAAVAMSRSAFALRFKSMVGVAPLEYLRRWRMQVAQNALRRRSCSVAGIALELGYASESAFGNAYKRTFGLSPKRHRVAV